MNKEIKEILNKIKNVKEPEMYITPKTGKKLIDYITNLQKQQNQFATTINELARTNVNFQKENERLRKVLNVKEELCKYLPKDTEFILLTKKDYERNKLQYSISDQVDY